MNEMNHFIVLGLCAYGITEFANELTQFVLRKHHEHCLRRMTRRRHDH